MRAQIRCDECGATSWHKCHTYEEDTGAQELDDRYPLDEACQHIQDGGGYTILDTEEDGE
jgi:hypothetical protein